MDFRKQRVTPGNFSGASIMANKSTFEPAEWTRVIDGVLSAGLAVSMAEPSGLIGMVQEGFASAKDLAAAKNDPKAGDLIKAIVADLETSAGRTAARDGLKASIKGKSRADAKAACIATLHEAGALVSAKAPQEAPAFKAWLLQISQHVAEASTEGGFLGFGGVAVSEAEKATLAEIKIALG
jgi:hypothetical protein